MKENNTQEIWVKHFGNIGVVSLSHKNIEAFFSELNEDCIREMEIINLEEMNYAGAVEDLQILKIKAIK